MSTQPLTGIRVLDLSWIVAGPQCTRILADFGAEVIRVENRRTLDSLRFARPHATDSEPPESSGFFNTLNRNKKSITLNARHPVGIKVLKELIGKSDVLVENFSSRVLENWGLGYPQIREVRKDIIYVSISGFGHTGRNHNYTTWGPTAQALSGLTLMAGIPHKEPSGWGYSYMDHQAGYLAAIATLASLRHRRKTGEGQHIDMSQVEAGITLCGTVILDHSVNGRHYRDSGNPPGNRAVWPKAAPHNTYPCLGNDKWIMITCLSHTNWTSLCKVADKPEWIHDNRFATLPSRLRYADELDELITTWTKQRQGTKIMEALQAAKVPAGLVQDLPTITQADPQMRARQFTYPVDHQVLGKHLTDGIPARLSKTPGNRDRSAPLLGQDNNLIFRGLLGYDDTRMAEMLESGVFG